MNIRRINVRSFVAMLMASAWDQVSNVKALQVDATKLDDVFAVKQPVRYQPFGQSFHGRTIGTRKAMRAAKKRRRIEARLSKRTGGVR